MKTKLIIGLGNPTKKYKNTRHNIGFIFIDMLSEKYNIKFKRKFDSLIGELIINNTRILLIKPQTFMNTSGIAVKQVVEAYNVDTNDILLIFDDLDLPFGKIKFKLNSSAGGHNGVKDIIEKLHTQNIQRIKYGILNQNKKDIYNITDFVLSKFSREEINKIHEDFNLIEEEINKFLKI